jgi:hypothetical protein
MLNPPGQGGFNIELLYYGPPLSAGATAAFENARSSIQLVVTGDLADISAPASPVNIDANCGTTGAPAHSTAIDDVKIYVRVASIDGPGGVLAQAGPCFIRTANLLTTIGIMEFDADDIAPLEANGLLNRVVLHEMLHVLGIGTLWDPSLFGLLNGGGTPNPIYNGINAIAGCLSLAGGGAACGAGVPVENTGGPGTADGHWRESVFGRELMTGFVNTGANPMSIITVRSLQDLGYTVDVSRAEAYTIGPALRAAGAPPPQPIDEHVLRPRGLMDAAGRITPIPR